MAFFLQNIFCTSERKPYLCSRFSVAAARVDGEEEHCLFLQARESPHNERPWHAAPNERFISKPIARKWT